MGTHRVYGVVTCLLLLCFSINPVLAQDENIRQNVKAYLKPYVANKDFAGAVLIAKDGEVLVKKGFGLASQELEVKNTPQTVFHSASVTKQFTAAAVLILEQQGKLKVEDAVARYLPDYPNGDKITIHHLLAQRSGIPDYNDFSDYDEVAKKQSSLKKTVNWFKNEPLTFEPGTQYGYSNSNYVLLAHLIKVVSGLDYRAFLQQYIFDPLHMRSTGNFTRAEIVENRAEGYDPAPGGLRNAPWYDMSFKLGSGSLFTTVEDLYKWDRALYGDAILSDASKQKMFTDHGNNYGYGWGVYERDGNAFASHDGKSPGSFGYIKRYFDNQDITIIFLSNINSGALNRLKADLTSIVFGGEYEQPDIWEEVELTEQLMDDYMGEYDFPPRFNFTIIKKEEGLYFQWMDTPFLQYLTPIARDKFIMRSRYDQLTFVRNGEGEVVHVLYDQGGDDATICPKQKK